MILLVMMIHICLIINDDDNCNSDDVDHDINHNDKDDNDDCGHWIWELLIMPMIVNMIHV